MTDIIQRTRSDKRLSIKRSVFRKEKKPIYVQMADDDFNERKERLDNLAITEKDVIQFNMFDSILCCIKDNRKAKYTQDANMIFVDLKNRFYVLDKYVFKRISSIRLDYTKDIYKDSPSLDFTKKSSDQFDDAYIKQALRIIPPFL